MGADVAVGTTVAVGDGVGVLANGVGLAVVTGLTAAGGGSAAAVAVGSGAEPHAAASRARSAGTQARAFMGAHIGSCRMDGAIAKVRVGSTIPEAPRPGHLARSPPVAEEAPP